MHPEKKPKLALVLSGGGARGAYEAGVIHYIRTMLPKEIGEKRGFNILCGSSVGAINICLVASTAHDLRHQGRHSYELWRRLQQSDIYQRDVWSFIKFLSHSAASISKNLLSKKYGEGGLLAHHNFRGILNTAPLIPFLKKNVSWQQISVNLKNRCIDAISITATNIVTGKLELFIEKRADLPYTGRYLYHDTKIEVFHAMASSAIPLIFPAVRIKKNYYMDGGVRMNTPMSPAIQLGAEKILVIGIHHQKEGPEYAEPEKLHEHYTITGAEPSMGDMIGKILNSLFLDKLDYDIEQLNRINRIITWAEECYGADFVPKINDYLLEKRLKGDIASRGLKKLSVMKIFPSQDLREVFRESIEKTQFFKKNLTRLEKTLLKILDVDLNTGKDFLSFIMFYPEYLHRLLELGFEDARSNHDKLIEFLS